uniref:Uncharacterized protein n=1 Tax=Hyaloperonospora arabidopsidis (strain Emoy2) TaxID=559515 RepID=M4BZ63_HYAAE
MSSTVYMASPGSQAATAIITGSDYGDANREALTAGLRGSEQRRRGRHQIIKVKKVTCGFELRGKNSQTASSGETVKVKEDIDEEDDEDGC